MTGFKIRRMPRGGHGDWYLRFLVGANLRELMERMGHSSSRAATIYLHSSGERQRKIADALGELAKRSCARPLSRAAT